MTVDFFALRRGDVLPSVTFAMSGDEVRAYLDATGEAHDRWSELVPPLALGALALGALMEQLPLPSGALHAAQEFEFLAPVAHDARVEVQMSVAQQAVRAGSTIVVIASVLESGGEPVARARSTVMAAAEAAPGTEAS